MSNVYANQFSAGTVDTLDQALAVVAAWGAPNHTRPDARTERGRLLAAAELLAAYVRQHRPEMPHAQRGRSVDHAVELADVGGVPKLVSLCGGLTPEPFEHRQPVELDALPVFDPHDPASCKTCRRRLPAELRPVEPAKPKRDRQHNRLADVEVHAGLDGEASLISTYYLKTGEEIAAYPYAVHLDKLNNDVRQYLRKETIEA